MSNEDNPQLPEADTWTLISEGNYTRDGLAYGIAHELERSYGDRLIGSVLQEVYKMTLGEQNIAFDEVQEIRPIIRDERRLVAGAVMSAQRAARPENPEPTPQYDPQQWQDYDLPLE